ncbi:hypothetical protein A3I27_02845 [Candidatus Giovannonibacteria bacterium RIFCSPLOWO2_02_FULL_43_11b]|uniref:Uncharacterized protein n=1 Tax=Candidatus Giovannonibacteria bacterium RIFCSPHIGHO2_12_FULL_43_15 TaxID=1798341 RepID=A0A1F5WQZ0_9BACT|nr:MAG: hypothetical protein A2739_00080 [Candidatus Giovannonibacteria bacterium RIFCSPHIGHO2_01_FULL_43_100]OGF66101.1 MAG: hypothetical protein A3B97_01190 [Candidatus Giovannonibacteria bacterium RIFCSPHIGHO2_02_FULL_43_32]OGF78079.1 MAG: hypothetical protein A3F23_02655 [Candidatus Giovannonibacteria bacterium RIFCSPHIGHO2_12_FULL_43_15]OGF78822.1 MAG: hypothetical protein A3A15_00345 [Candidatus Giovannonibacteria bacterium RIFCSPLOWO2_01_FULL_43_60]OGF89147.1 MAG: hypothetical protein A3
MPTISIPKRLAKEDLIVIPKREYEEFSQWRKNIRIRLDDSWFWTKEWQKKEAEADKAIRNGKIEGPFSDSSDLLVALKSTRKKK